MAGCGHLAGRMRCGHCLRARVAVLVLAALAGGGAFAWPVPAGAAIDAGSDDRVPVDCSGAAAAPTVEYSRLAPNIPVGDSMTVAPTTIPLLGVQAGDACTVEMRVENRRRERTAYDLLAIGVLGSDEPGRSLEYLDGDDPRADGTAQRWVEIPIPSVELDPRQVATLPVTVRVPGEVTAGGHYAAVAVRARGVEQPVNDEVAVQSQVAVPVFVDIAGTEERRVRITDLVAPGVVYAREAYGLEVRVRNTGNTFATPGGTVRVEGLFGRQVAQVQLRGGRILLPEGAGSLEARWRRTPWFGRYTVTVTSRAQEGGSSATRTTTFWALPPWWVFAAIAALVLLVAWNRWRAARDGDADHEHDDDDDSDSDDGRDDDRYDD
jgi:hypothetical protein